MSTTHRSTTHRSMRADARRSHDAIPAAAGDLFAGRGSEVQMDEIAERAGVGIGTMYRHFATKQALGGDAAPVGGAGRGRCWDSLWGNERGAR